MTYRRVEILADTIQKIMSQTWPPAKLLIVDNDEEMSAEILLKRFPEYNISYHGVGYNSGPAGAAKRGLATLFGEGWEWVLWMDDNDPPQFTDVIEHIFQIPNLYHSPDKIGMIGAVGVLFNKLAAKTIRVPDDSLSGIIEVDNIAGNMLPIVHKRVFEKNIQPDEQLFFGFEELDFSLAVKRAGLAVLVSGEELYRHREKAGRLQFKRPLYKVKDAAKLWREYYSVRNIVYLLKYKEKSYVGLCCFLVRVITKSIIGFRWGWYYGTFNFRYLLKGYFAGFNSKMGKAEL